MKLKKLICTAIGVSLIAGTIFTGCTAKEGDKTYLIATDVTYAPFEFEQDGKYVGIDVDLIAAIAELEGFKYELKPMEFKGIIPALTSNQIDGAISGMTITDERKEALDFSEGYFESGTSAVIRKDNTDIKTLEDFKGKTFAVKKGTTGSKYAEDNKDALGGTITYFDDTTSMFQEVANGNADITFEDYPVIAYMLTVDPSSPLKLLEKISTADYGFAVNKGKNEELLKAFNSGLKKLKESGEYDKIVAKYIKE